MQTNKKNYCKESEIIWTKIEIHTFIFTNARDHKRNINI